MSAYVLVVDDDPSILQLVSDILLDQGYQVAAAQSAEEALRRIEYDVPAVMVTDLMMPDMDGRALAEACRARARTASMPILLMSAVPVHLDGVSLLNRHEVLAKPFDIVELVEIIARMVASSASGTVLEAIQENSDRGFEATSVAKRTTRGLDVRQPRVLIMLDRPILTGLVALTLNHGVCTVRAATTPELARDIATEWQPDLLLLDMALDGIRTMRHVRAVAASPVFVMGLVERGDLSSKLAAIDAGVDDILAVPFVPDELLARVIALTRRSEGTTVGLTPVIQIGEFQINILSRTVRIGDSEVHLTTAELSLLYLLAANTGRVLTRHDILDTLWGTAQAHKLGLVDQHVRTLRALIPTPQRTGFVTEVAGRGYQFQRSGSLAGARPG
jgi:DNA-binding response OmpR family regulator